MNVEIIIIASISQRLKLLPPVDATFAGRTSQPSYGEYLR